MRMRYRIRSFAAACCFLSLIPVNADVLTIKNGKKIEGTVLREEGENYVVEVRVTATIRDEKIVPRADVLRIEKTPEYEKAFVEIATLSPAPELLSQEGYEERIEKLKKYIETFSKSNKIAKVEEMIKSLEEELDLIKGGAIKFDEGIISAEQYEANAYEFDARIAEKKIRGAVARRDYLTVLRRFDSYEMSFGVAEGYAALTPLIEQVLVSYSESLAESLASLESRLVSRDSGLARMSAGDRAKSIRALDDEQSQLAARLQEEKAAKVKWITPHAYYKESLEEAVKQAASEIAKLDTFVNVVNTPLAELYRTAWEKLQATEDNQKKQAILDEVKAKNLPESYLEKLIKRAGLTKEVEK